MSSLGWQYGEDGIPWILKHPAASLSYTVDLSEWLGTDTLTGATWTVPPGLTKVAESHDTTTATVKLAGGKAGADYVLTLAWTCAAGADSRDMVVKVRHR